MRLKGKTALITGAGQGFGFGIAEIFVREGARVACLDMKADVAEAAAKRFGGGAIALNADVSNRDDVERAARAAIEAFSRVDIVVNNAGTTHRNKPLMEVEEAEFDRIFAVNVKGTYFCCQQAAKRMADGGRIVNLSTSITALLLPTYSAYAASKGGVEQITRILAKELGPRRITVNAVSPGPTDTELFGQDKTEEEKRRFGQMAALGRLGQPQDIADVVAMLCSQDARWITGQNVRANGGTI